MATNNVQTSIDASPFYKQGYSTLPNTEQVAFSGLYMMDDTGGIVFQLTNNGPEAGRSKFPTGLIDLDKKTATVGPVDKLDSPLGATSYKYLGPGGPNNKTTEVELKEGITINQLTKVDADLGVPIRKGLTIQIEKTDEYFYLYDVYSPNGQLPIIHTVTPIGGPSDTTETEVQGMVYVEYKQDIYIGFLENTHVLLGDPNGIFRF